MAARDHLQPQQLAMFMPARELYKTHDLGDDRGDSPVSKMATMVRKRQDNKKYGLPDPATPIDILHGGERPMVSDGHHRLAEALRTNQEVPLAHIDAENWWS